MSTTTYLPASFRDARFLVESTSDEGGPRNIIHEFPGRNDAYAEPSGRFPKRFTIEAHLIGDDFESQLRALEDALDQDGPGKLIHPHRGAKQVAVDGPYRVQRHTGELGMARLSITFCETGAQEPRAALDTTTSVKAKIAALTPRARKPIDLRGPDFLTRAATSILSGPRGVVSALRKINNRINAGFGLIDQVSSTLDAFSAEVTTLLLTPDTLGTRLQDLVNSVLGAVTAAGFDLNRGDKQRNASRVSAVLGYLSVLGNFGDSLPAVATPTATRQQEADNQAALVDSIETAGVIGAVGALVDLPFDNTDQAGAAFDVVRAVFDRIAARGTLDDASGQALRDLRAAFHRHLRSTSAELPGLGRFTPATTAPALVLAYRLYGDSTREQEIVDRNPTIEHPGFVQGGVELAIAEI